MKNRATIARETKQAAAIAEMIDSGKPLAITVLQKAMEFAEGAVATFKPTTKKERAKGTDENPDGDLEEFGKWFDRWYRCISELAQYQTAKIKAMEAPAAAPKNGENANVIEYSLRVFEGGRMIAVPKDDDEAA